MEPSLLEVEEEEDGNGEWNGTGIQRERKMKHLINVL